MTEQEEYQRIVDNPPPIRRDFIIRDTKTVYTEDGYRFTQTTSGTHAGVPELVTLEEDLHDSFWRYPLIAKRIIGTVKNKIPANHATYWSAKRVNK